MTFRDLQLNSMTFQALKISFQVFHDLYKPCGFFNNKSR